VTDQEKAILLRMTGLDSGPTHSRIHFATGTGSANYACLLGLVEQGLAIGPAPPRARFPGLRFFFVTEAGVKAANEIAAARNQEAAS
jgi:hypothetical protein